MELWECLLSASLIGVRSACASRISLAVDRNAPVMWSAAVRWTLANLLMKPTDPKALLPGIVWWIGVSHISTAYSILGMAML